MGLWGRRGNKVREKLRPSRSSSYSDDYRITPELAGIEGHKNGGGGGGCDECYTRNRVECCPGNDPCCSQDEGCCPSPPPPQHHRSHSPRRRRSASADTARVRGSSLGAMEVVVVDEGRRVDLRHQNFCTSCESCDTCDWTAHDSFTRVDLNNSSVHLFAAPLNTESTDSLSDHNSPPTPPPPTRSRVSPHRRTGGGSPKNRSERRGEGEGGRQQQIRPDPSHPRQQSRGEREKKPLSRGPNVQRSVTGHSRAPSAARERVQRRLSRRDSHKWQQHTGQS